MEKQMRTLKTQRPYTMRRRAEHVDETRRRITEAAVRLHTTVGPAHTTIAGVAEEAGVTRLTVYRHFPDLESLFEACTSHWLAAYPFPDPSALATSEPFGERARMGLARLYRWYADRRADLVPIHRDVEAMPATVRALMGEQLRSTVAALLDGVERPSLRLRAVAGHVVRFDTWRSLADGGLDPETAADVTAGWLVEASRNAA